MGREEYMGARAQGRRRKNSCPPGLERRGVTATLGEKWWAGSVWGSCFYFPDEV